ncbi:MAG: ABC transporter ATP-binding protein [Firmicutes bacterium]|nr:ABC transporter ATP-binding protein [[Eubacterium] siraeum]MCM1489043.1 ABC transporter ATP-binding protein [Bacillota bacterium]
MVTIRNLQKSYGQFKVLAGLDMNVPDGEVYGFLGKNGCGKSTTMNILCNIIPKDGGDVLLGEEGQQIKIGYLPETPSMFTYMNGYEYLRYIAACCRYKDDVEQRVNEVLDIVGMTEGGKRRIKGYSRGMNQRLGIASIIFDKPQLLVLDEPTSALDPEGRSDVMRIIRQLADMGSTIILCTHILSDVEKVAGSIGILVNGKMAVEGKITDVEKRYFRPEVELKLYDADQRAIDAIKSLERQDIIDKVDFYERTGVFVLRTADPKRTTEILTQTLAQNSLVPLECKTVTESLEEIYLKVVNGNA